MIFQLAGGPADGETVNVAEPFARAILRVVKGGAPIGTFDTSALAGSLWALYLIAEERAAYDFVGITDEDVEFRDAAGKCRACGAERLALVPVMAEWPMQCPACEKMAMWPMPVKSAGAP